MTFPLFGYKRDICLHLVNSDLDIFFISKFLVHQILYYELVPKYIPIYVTHGRHPKNLLVFLFKRVQNFLCRTIDYTWINEHILYKLRYELIEINTYLSLFKYISLINGFLVFISSGLNFMFTHPLPYDKTNFLSHWLIVNDEVYLCPWLHYETKDHDDDSQ